MATERKLMCMLAHPDDESIGIGGILAKYAREGVCTHVLTATKGEKGRRARPSGTATPPLGEIRERELRAAARVLGVRDVRILGFRDGEVDREDPAPAIRAIAAHIRAVRPDVVVTLPPDGVDGHPDHVAVSQFAAAAILRAADPAFDSGGAPPHAVSKVYLIVWTLSTWNAYRVGFGRTRTVVDGKERHPLPWPEWAVTTEVDTAACCGTVWEAVQCHASQIAMRDGLRRFGEADRLALWGVQRFCRLSSLVNSGRGRERDLFEGLP